MTSPHIDSWEAEAGPGVVGTASRVETLVRLAELPDPGCDLVEVRLDQLMDEEGADWLGHCRSLHQQEIPLILTLRHHSERGNWSGDNATRLDLLQLARSWVGGVDVEIQRDAVPGAVRHLDGITVIGSYHDFETTPPDEVLDQVIRRGMDDGAHIVKLATWVQDEATLNRLEALPARYPGAHLALVGMGPLGPESRVRLPRAGSCLTYGFLDAAVAPGQVSAAELKAALA